MWQYSFASVNSRAGLRLKHDTTIDPRPFECCGLASLDDLNSAFGEALFSELEGIQQEFLSAQPHLDEYKWPRDPLHSWSRVWEYPFVYHNIKLALESQQSSEPPCVLDVGSGVTFFPFALARQGCNVITVDVDPCSVRSFAKASRLVPAAPGTARMLISDASTLPVKNASADCVCCISVLEHIERFETVIEEFTRVLKPGALLVLTVDLDLNGAFGFGAGALAQLRARLNEDFEMAAPDRTVHPQRLLTSKNSRYPLYPPTTGLRKIGQATKTAIRPFYRVLTGRRPFASRWHAATFGAILSRRQP